MLLALFATALALSISPCTAQNRFPVRKNNLKNIYVAFVALTKDPLILNFALLDVLLFCSFGLVSSASYPYINQILPQNIIARVGIYQLCLSSGSIPGNWLLRRSEKTPRLSHAIFYIFPLMYIANLSVPLLGLSPIIFLGITFLRAITASFYSTLLNTAQDLAIKKHESIRSSVYSVFEIIRDGFSALFMLAAGFFWGSFPYT